MYNVQDYSVLFNYDVCPDKKIIGQGWYFFACEKHLHDHTLIVLYFFFI